MTYPQLFLLSDGFQFNNIRENADKDGDERARPPKPDEETDPVGALRWQLKYELKMDDATVDYHCERLKEMREARGDVV